MVAYADQNASRSSSLSCLMKWKTHRWCSASGHTAAMTGGYSFEPSVTTNIGRNPATIKRSQKARTSASVAPWSRSS